MIETEWACLELTRTVGWEERDRPDDRLTDYAALLSWGEEVGVLEAAEAARLRRAAQGRPQEAEGVLERAIALRRLCYRIFSPIGAGETPSSPDLEALNEILPDANRRLRVVLVDGGYRWSWAEEEGGALDRVLWPLIRSAADLLTSDELARLRLCDAHDCGWLFIDASRNRSRRWCDMSDCGNRAKARRHRERVKREGSPTG